MVASGSCRGSAALVRQRGNSTVVSASMGENASCGVTTCARVLALARAASARATASIRVPSSSVSPTVGTTTADTKGNGLNPDR